jgi:hypothetical protein
MDLAEEKTTITELTDILDQDIEAIVSMRMNAERKVSKVIAMIDELRRDTPTVQNRVDREAEVMKEPVDPHTALSALNKTLQEAAREHQFEIE